MVKISAHETVTGQASSTMYFISSITSNPRSEFKLGPACFSLKTFPKSSSKIDASHPYEDHDSTRLKQKHVISLLKFGHCYKPAILLSTTSNNWSNIRNHFVSNVGVILWP